MKILIINPNSDRQMGEAILKTARDYAGDDFEVFCESVPSAPAFIETYEDISKSALGTIKLAVENEPAYDAFVIACHYDPNLDALKEVLHKPVIGIGEASIKVATMLGNRFSIITTDTHSIPIHEELVRKYHLQSAIASVRAPRNEAEGLPGAEKYLDTASLALEQDVADVLVLGCAGMSGLEKMLEKKLHVPVLDGIECALSIAVGLVKRK